MGFFSLLETFFFISLAITFVLIIMLVYHFKGRLVAIEDRYHTMFEIVNSLVKEMKNLRDMMIQNQTQAPPSFGGNPPGFPTDLFRLFQSGPGLFPSTRNGNEDDDEDDEDEDNENTYKKIVVSDTELDSEDEDEYEENKDIKFISVDMAESEMEPVSLAELEDPIDIDLSAEEVDDDSVVEENDSTSTEIKDYRKLDVSYLKTMVLTRGLATDIKKMKKNELIRLLEEANKESL